MPDELSRQAMPAEKTNAKPAAEPPLALRAAAWAQRTWRPAGTVVVILLALLMTWHVIYGNHGLSIWQQKRAEDHALQQEIDRLQQENAEMQKQVEHLKSDPDAIEREAREKLHYAKPGEVIYTLPDAPREQQK